MRVIIGDVWQQRLDAGQLTINGTISDPVNTCTLYLRDDNSSYQPQALQEVLILDDKAIPNPTVNLATNPTLLPYNGGGWTAPTPPTGLTTSQNGGGGATATLANKGAGSFLFLTQARTQRITPGVDYVFSIYNAGSVGASNFNGYIQILWFDTNGNSTGTATLSGGNPPGTGSTRFALRATAPANTVSATLALGVATPTGTNSGSITFTNAQFEPVWLPGNISYPTPFCGPSQTNCREMDDYYSMYIRQYRKFAGYILTYTADNYIGNARTWQIQCVGYAWLLSAIMCNNVFTNQYDDSIIGVLMVQYFAKDNVGSGTFNLAQVIRQTLLASVASNWDDLRTLMDNLAAQSGSYWTVDFYWNLIYRTPGTINMAISLICDDSANPDFVTTFPAYNFTADGDFSQPGTSALVIGSGTNVSEVIDPVSTTAALNTLRWVQTVNPAFFMRKINDTGLQSTTDTNTRGVAEVLLYNKTRKIYHLTTNVELVPGQSVPVTSTTEGLSAVPLLIQSVSTTWLGTDETLTDVWQYQADLGALNRKATSILNRIFRATNSNSSAPAIASTITLSNAYQTLILSNGPSAYWTLGDSTYGAVVDHSGHGFTGALNGTVSLNQPSLIAGGTDSSMAFNASSSTPGYVATSSPITNGYTAISVECWVKFILTPTSANPRLIANSHADFDNTAGFELAVGGTGITWPGFGTEGIVGFSLGTGSAHANLVSTAVLATGAIYHLVGTWDGTTMRLYINGFDIGTTTAFAGPNLGTSAFNVNLARDPNYAGDPAGAVLNQVALYNFAMTATQVLADFTTGTNGIYEADTGFRSTAIAAGWGTATDGIAWAVTNTANAKTTTSLLQLYNNAESFGVIGTANSLNCTVVALIVINNAAFVPGLLLRYTNTNNFIKLDVSAGTLRIRKRVAGTDTNVATGAVTMTVGTQYWFKLNVTGTTYSAKFWQFGTTEPGSYAISGMATDAVLASGQWGLYGSPTTSSTIDFAQFSVNM